MPEVVKHDGGTIHFDVRGPRDAPAMVLVEGLSAHLLGWRDGFCQPFLDAGYRVVRLDNRDVGLSQKYPDQPYGLADMADDVHELIEQLGISPAHVVAQSMGGMIAQHLVLRHPTDVASLTLLYTSASGRHVDATAGGRELGATAPRAKTREDAIELHLQQERVCASRDYSFDEAWKRELGGLMWDRCYDPAGVARQLEAVQDHAVDLHRLGTISVPTLIIHGTADALISSAAAVELNEAIPHSDLLLIDGMGHDLPPELWSRITECILLNATRASLSTPEPLESARSPFDEWDLEQMALPADGNRSPMSRIAGAPISWGVCEVPGWGYQLPSARVLEEMRALGLTATEFGPVGFLPENPSDAAALLNRVGLRPVGGFMPVVLHDDRQDPLPVIDAFVRDCVASGASVMVLAAATGVDGYDQKPVLTEAQWNTLCANVNRISRRTAQSGVKTVLHPHIGTVIETADDVARVLRHSEAMLCLDTGHLMSAGADPVAITVANSHRIGHVHLKDVDPALAAEVQAATRSFSDAVAAGLFCALGTGAVDVAAIVGALESTGYDGWYVLEQDLKLEGGEPTEPGPIEDVRTSLAYIVQLLTELGDSAARSDVAALSAAKR